MRIKESKRFFKRLILLLSILVLFGIIILTIDITDEERLTTNNVLYNTTRISNQRNEDIPDNTILVEISITAGNVVEQKDLI